MALIKQKVFFLIMPITVLLGEKWWTIKEAYKLLDERSLIIDCANCACPHTMQKLCGEEILENCRIIEVELYYKFRDVLLKVLEETSFDMVCVTPLRGLMTYQNKEEDESLVEQGILLLKRLSVKKDIVICCTKGSVITKILRKLGGDMRWVIQAPVKDELWIGSSKRSPVMQRVFDQKSENTLLSY
jgi:hypothetical protein